MKYPNVVKILTLGLISITLVLGIYENVHAVFLSSLFGPKTRKIEKAKSIETVVNRTKSNPVTYDFMEAKINNKSIPLHLVTIDLNRVEITPEIVLASERFGKIRKLSTICKNKGAIAAINGAFFSVKSRHPVGYLILDGKPIKAPLAFKERTTFGIMNDNSIRIGKPKFRRRIRPQNEYFSVIDDINKTCGNFEIVLYNREFGKTADVPEGGKAFLISTDNIIKKIVTEGKIEIPETGNVLIAGKLYVKNFEKTEIGNTIELTQTLMYPWENIRSGFGSVVGLVENGDISFDSVKEKVSSGIKGRAARSAVGITVDNKLLLLATDAKSRSFRGITLNEQAEIMQAIGADSAVSLDGGSSTTMYYNGRIVNTLHKGRERPVATALIITPVK